MIRGGIVRGLLCAAFMILPAATGRADAAGGAWIADSERATIETPASFPIGATVTNTLLMTNDSAAACEFIYRWEVTLKGRALTGEEDTGEIGPAALLAVPFSFTVPDSAQEQTEGCIRLIARIGDLYTTNEVTFTVIRPDPPFANGPVALYDPIGQTRDLLRSLGYEPSTWAGETNVSVVVIGKAVLSENDALPANLQVFVRSGGRVLIMAQSPEWLREQAGFRLSVASGFRAASAHDPLARELAASWSSGDSPADPLQLPGETLMAVAENPHRAGWHPVLAAATDESCSPLLFLDYGKGRLVLCTLPLENLEAQEQAGRLLRTLIEWCRAAPSIPRSDAVFYVGGDDGLALLDRLGVVYRRVDALPGKADLVVVEPRYVPVPSAADEFLKKGGRLLVLPHEGPNEWVGIGFERASGFPGSANVPPWAETVGVSAEELQGVADSEAWLIRNGTNVEIGADGLLGRKSVGRGVMILVQKGSDTPEKTGPMYFDDDARRPSRLLTQLLANMGATFAADHAVMVRIAGKK